MGYGADEKILHEISRIILSTDYGRNALPQSIIYLFHEMMHFY
jgi:hypothetical protein